MTILVMGLATAFNFVILIWKIRKQRYADFMLDMSILAIISFLFAGTMTGLAAGMVASMLVSFYLLFKPVGFTKTKTKSKKHVTTKQRYSAFANN